MLTRGKASFYINMERSIYMKQHQYPLLHSSASPTATASSIVPSLTTTRRFQNNKKMVDRKGESLMNPSNNQNQPGNSIVSVIQQQQHYRSVRQYFSSSISTPRAPSTSSNTNASPAPIPLPLYAVQYEFVENMVEKRAPYREKHLKLLEKASGCLLGGMYL